jgi:acyl-CoA synthetase (AMP-forming)/AMP-acid ligase II
MSVNLYVNMLAIFYIGATAVFLDQWSSSKRLNLACQIAACKAMVGIKKAKLLWFVSSAFRKIPVYLKPNLSGRALPIAIGRREARVEAKTALKSIEPHPSQKERHRSHHFHNWQHWSAQSGKTHTWFFTRTI